MPPGQTGPVLLLFPPQWTPQNPSFGLTSLGGHLRHTGLETRLVDLNLRFYQEVLKPEHLRFCRELTRSRAEHLRNRCKFRLMFSVEGKQLDRDAAHLLRLDELLERPEDPWEEAAAGIDQALSWVRSPEHFYNPARLVPALVALDQALDLVAAPYDTQLALNDFRATRYPLTVEAMEEATRDSWGNPFLSLMKKWIPELTAHGPSLVALSISSFSQILAGLTLARLLKQALPDTHLTLGGNFFGRVADRLQKNPLFFRLFCDSLVVGEGEVAFEQLARAVQAGQPVEQVARVLTAGGRGPLQPQHPVPLEELGPLDLADLPLDEYFSPEPVVCIQASRGCYWGQCSFCDSYWGVKLDKKSTPRLMGELRHLNEKYGIRHFEFIDECLTPEDMADMARAIQQSKLRIHWFANARTEKGFQKILPRLPQAGLSMLLWGFESASPRILKLLAKGVHPAQRWRILRASANAGIWNFAYIFFGFPGESRVEAEETIEALCTNTDLLHSYGRSIYTLGRHSPMAQEPEKYGLANLVEEGTDLSVNLTYTNHLGPDPDEVQQRVELCTRRCRQAYGDPLWMALRNRENLHLYLVHYGSQKVREWSLSPDDLKQVVFQK
ncbi:MAG: radical SAM protein [Vulcanimicrobiota bacterium]